MFLVRWENYVVGEMISEREKKEKEEEDQKVTQNVEKYQYLTLIIELIFILLY